MAEHFLCQVRLRDGGGEDLMAFKRTNTQSRALSGFHVARRHKSRNRFVAFREHDIMSGLYLLNQVAEFGRPDFRNHRHGTMIQLCPRRVEHRFTSALATRLRGEQLETTIIARGVKTNPL